MFRKQLYLEDNPTKMIATNQKIRRLPGFRFETQSAARENVLPRMDIAVFVGFASSGPIETPVVLESIQEFKNIFGEDLPLVWDEKQSETVYAYLAPAVRSFFKNGGKRCWVIRVARTVAEPKSLKNRACANFFPMAGFIGFDFDKKSVVPAAARSRSRGSWSDDLRVGTAVSSRAVKLVGLSNENGQKKVEIEISSKDRLEKGELVRLRFEDSRLLLTVDEILPEAKAVAVPNLQRAKKKVSFVSKNYLWLVDLPDCENDTQGGKHSVHIWAHQRQLNVADFMSSAHLVEQANLTFIRTKKDLFGNKTSRVRLEFDTLKPADAPGAGSLLAIKYPDKSLCLKVKTVNFSNTKPQDKIEVLCDAVFVRNDHSGSVNNSTAEKLTFEIWVKKADTHLQKLSGLNFNAGNERFWGDLPVDEDVFGVEEKEIPPWTQNADAKYFPLAGIESESLFYFPVFPTAVPEDFLGAIPPLGTKIERDGLAKFEASLFLDEKLKNTSLENLLTDAEFIRYLSENPRNLFGIHRPLAPETFVNKSAEGLLKNQAFMSLSLDEATIISVPDALHRGWVFEKDKRVVLPPLPSDPPLRPEWWTFQCAEENPPKPISEPPWEKFLKCGLRVIKKPKNLRIKEHTISDGKFTLQWDCDETDPETNFVLEESTDRSFRVSRIIYPKKASDESNSKEFFVSKRSAGIYYYRVKAVVKNEFSDWSDGFPVKVPAAENWRLKTVEEFEPDVLLAVQRALLRMCAARGDMFAVLDLPEHFDRKEALLYIGELKKTKGLTVPTAGVEPFSNDELRSLSFSAVYHPWVFTREEERENVRLIPPSGSICGVMAHRTLRRGAWIAPANEALQGVLGIGKNFGRDEFLDFQDGLINLVRKEPRGFLVLDSDTLSDDADWRPINVRRLISLLRRLALKHGTEYVFEPNDERFRRQVQRGFSALLDGMFMRGAFAGATPATAYQVNVSEALNNFQSVGEGRLIIELKVAPSLPLKFVNVRLVQTGGRIMVTETV